MVKHIFFDLDRTLWDFEVNSHETLLELCVKYNLNDLGINDYESFIKRYKCHNEKLWVLYRNNSISQKELRKERFHKETIFLLYFYYQYLSKYDQVFSEIDHHIEGSKTCVLREI